MGTYVKQTSLVGVLITALAAAPAIADYGYADSSEFAVDLLSMEMGAIADWSDSPNFAVDLLSMEMGPIADWSDSPNFSVDLWPVNRGWGDSNTFTADTPGPIGDLRVVALTPSHSGVFASGIDFINTVEATIDWRGHVPQTVVFNLNGNVQQVPASGPTASTSFNMGSDLTYSSSGARNELAVYAVAADGSFSPVVYTDFYGLGLPEWAISIETMEDIGYRIDPLTGKLTFYGEVEVIEAGVEGTVTIPNSIPEIGGKWGVEIAPLNFEWELSAQPRFGDGAGLTGSFDLSGSWKAEAKCGTKRKGEIAATLSGAGEFYPEFRLTDVSAELAGSFTFLFPRVPLLCQWTGCCHTGYCPYFQASIKPAVAGIVGLQEGEPDLIAGLKFKNATLNISVTVAGTVGAGSEGSIYYIAGTIGGRPYIVLQFPGDPDSSCLNEYIQEVGFDLEARFVVECAWWKYEQKWVFNLYTCPRTGRQYLLGTPCSEKRFGLVDRKYLAADEGYCVFPEDRDDPDLRSVPGLPGPILNVGTGPLPSLAATSDAGLLLFVYDDATKPTGKHQEIYWARWTGSAWTAHAPLTDNLGPDIQPVAAIDGSGTEIAVWVAGPEPDGTETGPRDILPGLEVVYATYDVGTSQWSTPAALTSNTQADLLPWFERSLAGALRVCWITSPTNAIPTWHDEEIVPSIDMMAADWDGVAFGTPYPVATGLSAVSPPALARTDTHEIMAYLLDVDDNSGTTEDREVVVRTRELGQAWGPDEQLTFDALSDSAVQAGIDSNGLPVVAWVKRMVPVPVPDEDDTAVDQLWFVTWNGAAWSTPTLALEADGIAEPKLIRNAAGKLVLFWVAASAEFSDIFYSVHDANLGLWGLPQQVTHDQDAETMISLAVSGGNILAAYVNRRIDLATSNGLPEIGLSDIYLMEHVPQKDLVVDSDGLSFDPDPMVPGEPATVCVDVRLTGDFTVEDVLVEFREEAVGTNGVVIGTDTISRMLPGERVSACVTWQVPNDGRERTLVAVVDPANTIPETDDTGNNTASVVPFRPDLRISSPVVVGYPGPETILAGCTVRNVGTAAAGAFALEVRRDNDQGELVFQMEIPGLEAGGSVSIQFAWDVTALPVGDYVLAYHVDPADVVTEINETNNTASLGVPVKGDLRAEQWSATYEPGTAALVVRNAGAKPMAATVVRAYVGEQVVGEAPVAALEAGSSVEVSISIAQAVPAGWLTLTVNPDSDGSDEVTLLNNTTTAVVSASGDSDGDGDVDLEDYEVFADCLAGPNVPPTPTDPLTAADCLAIFDFQADGDVDLADFAVFAQVFGTAMSEP
jgi:hypothetical protein